MKRLLGICCVFAWLLSGCGAKASVTKPSQSTTHTDRTTTSSHAETTSSQNTTFPSADASSSVESTTTTTIAPTTTTITSTTTTTISSTTTTHTTSTFPSTTVSSHTTTSTATTPTSSTTTILTHSSYSTTIITTTTTTIKPTTGIDTTTTKSVGITTIAPTTAPTTTTTTTTPTSTTVTTTPSNTVAFKATVRDNASRQPIEGLVVTVYADSNTDPIGFATTDQKGVARITIEKSNSYRVVLSNLPAGYECDPEYRFSSNTVNINLRKAAVQNENDHSQAQYRVGQPMTNFTLTDTDGNIYRLSELLKTNQLIILDFWFATCEPCKGEFPFFEAAVQKYGDKITLLAVNPIDSMSVIHALRNRYNANPDTALSFPMVKDTCNLHLGFDVVSYPTTVFIDSNGQIVDIHLDAYTSEAAFFAAIERYLH